MYGHSASNRYASKTRRPQRPSAPIVYAGASRSVTRTRARRSQETGADFSRARGQGMQPYGADVLSKPVLIGYSLSVRGRGLSGRAPLQVRTEAPNQQSPFPTVPLQRAQLKHGTVS